VKDVIQSDIGKEDDWDLPGYSVKKVVTNFDKPSCVFIPKVTDKPQDFISLVMKNKKLIPSPDKYDTSRNPIGKNPKFYMAKAKNQSFFEGLIDESKKLPGVGKYQVSPRQRITGTYTQNTARGSANDDAIYKAQNSPS
jgi:hypothetical protein